MIASMRLLDLAKPSYTHALESSEARNLEKREDEFDFVSDFLFAVLLSHYRSAEELYRILRLDCMRAWHGWREADAQLSDCGCDDEKEDVAAEFVRRLRKIVHENQHVTAQSDTARRQELRRMGKVFGIGAVHGHNECLADSLLQLLEAHAFLPQHLGKLSVSMRAAACRSCRGFLTSDDQEEALRPKQRTETGAVADALPSEHNRAFLQHDVHAEPVVRFFLRYFESESSIEPQGIRILVYTR